MTSQISFSKLLGQDMRRRRWTLIMFAIIQFLAGPFTLLFKVTTRDFSGTYYSEYAGIYDSVSDGLSMIMADKLDAVLGHAAGAFGTFGIFVAYLAGILIALAGFGFLFSKKKMDLYGSVPVSRKKLFLAVYLNGFMIWFVTLFVSMLACLLIAGVWLRNAVCFGQVLSAYAEYLLTGAVGMLAIYNVCLVAVMLSGEAFTGIVNSVLIGLDVIAGWGILHSIFITYMDTYISEELFPGGVGMLSTFTVPVVFTELLINQIEIAQPILYIVGSVIFILINFGLAFFLFIRRKSELAENGTTNKPYLYVIKTVTACICGLCAAMLMSSITSFGVYIWSIIGLTIAVMVSFGVLNIIFAKVARAFFRDWQFMIGAGVLSIAIFLFAVCDTFGYDTFVPRENTIASAEVYFSDFDDQGINFKLTEDGKSVVSNYVSTVDLLGKCTLTDKDEIHDLLEMAVSNEKSIDLTAANIVEKLFGVSYIYDYDNNMYSDEDWTTFYVRVYLKSGTSYVRVYRIYESQYDSIRDIVESKDYLDGYYSFGSGMFPDPDEITVWKYDDELEYSTEIYYTDPEVISLVMQCYYKDFAEHCNMEDLIENNDYSEDLNLTYFDADNFGSDGSYYANASVYLPLYDNYERSLMANELLMSGRSTEEIKEALKEGLAQ